MTTAPAASSATQSVALVPKKVAARLRAVLQEAEAQEEARREAAARVAEDILQENRTVVAVAPAVMRMIIIHRAAVAEAAEDNG